MNQAIVWWNNLPLRKQSNLKEKYFKGKLFVENSIERIEFIYKQENDKIQI